MVVKRARRRQSGALSLILLALGCAATLLVVAAPRLGAAGWRMVGDEGVRLALTANRLSGVSHERAVRSRERAMDFVEHRRSLIELGVLLLGEALHAAPGSERRRTLMEGAEDAILRSLTFSPVQPVGTMLLTRIAFERANRLSMAWRLELSLRTGRFVQSEAWRRSVLGLFAWPLLEPETQALLVPSLAVAIGQDASTIAGLAVDGVIEDEVAAMLAAAGEETAQEDFEAAVAVALDELLGDGSAAETGVAAP